MEATKFALRLLKDHCDEGTFAVQFENPEECHTMTDRFKRLGCEAKEDPRKLMVEVVCPPALNIDQLERSVRTGQP